VLERARRWSGRSRVALAGGEAMARTLEGFNHICQRALARAAPVLHFFSYLSLSLSLSLL